MQLGLQSVSEDMYHMGHSHGMNLAYGMARRSCRASWSEELLKIKDPLTFTYNNMDSFA